MSILDLYAKNTSNLDAPKPTTYQEIILQRESTGQNALVQKDLMDPTFRPPLPEDTYIATTFKEGLQ